MNGDPLDRWRAAASDPSHPRHRTARDDRAGHTPQQRRLDEYDGPTHPTLARARERIRADGGEVPA